MALGVGRDLVIAILIALLVGTIAGRLTSTDPQTVSHRAAVAPSAPRGGACRAADALDVCRAAFLSQDAAR